MSIFWLFAFLRAVGTIIVPGVGVAGTVLWRQVIAIDITWSERIVVVIVVVCFVAGHFAVRREIITASLLR